MAKIFVQVQGREPCYLHFNNEDKIKKYFEACGYSAEEITRVKAWALGGLSFSPTTYTLPGAVLRMERGNVETFDVRAGDWVDSPPEMEAFLADIDDVCRKHGLYLCTEAEDGCGDLLVRAYRIERVSLIDGAHKDYDLSEINFPGPYSNIV